MGAMILPKKIDDWPDLYRELYEERAGIIEFCGNKPKMVAEFIAEDAVRRMALEEGMLNWDSLT